MSADTARRSAYATPLPHSPIPLEVVRRAPDTGETGGSVAIQIGGDTRRCRNTALIHDLPPPRLPVARLEVHAVELPTEPRHNATAPIARKISRHNRLPAD